MVIRMGTKKSVTEINYLLSEIINKEFKHRGEIAEELNISPITLNKWIEISCYNWDDFNINYTQSLEDKLNEIGGINYLKQKFKEGHNITTLADELQVNQGTLEHAITQILNKEKVSKKELGYIKRIPKKTMKMYNLIDEKGGVPYLLSGKLESIKIQESAEDIVEGITREFIFRSLKQYNLTFTELSYWNNVYYIPHLKKWRGTLIVDGEVYDTELYDTIFDALDVVTSLKKIKRNKSP